MTLTAKPKRCVVQQRDIEVLKYIKDSKTMTAEQIRQRFWPTNKPNSIRRMSKLVEKGLLTKVDMEFLKYPVHYFITKKALKLLITHGLATDNEDLPIPPASDVIRSDHQHNMRVTNIRIALEMEKGIRVKNWISDPDIRTDPEAYGLEGDAPLKDRRDDPAEKERRSKNRIPDAIFKFEDDEHEGKMILEYEHGFYQRWKFRAYMSAWEEHWSDYQKFIVASTPERVGVLTQWCLRDLKNKYRLELANQKVDLKRLAQSYMFTDYHSLMDKGIFKCGLRTPISYIKLKALSTTG